MMELFYLICLLLVGFIIAVPVSWFVNEFVEIDNAGKCRVFAKKEKQRRAYSVNSQYARKAA